MNIRLGTGFTVFIIFFGVSLLSALSNFSIADSLFWLLIGIVFVLTENMGSKKEA